MNTKLSTPRDHRMLLHQLSLGAGGLIVAVGVLWILVTRTPEAGLITAALGVLTMVIGVGANCISAHLVAASTHRESYLDRRSQSDE
jgi:xanthosine utilization system XapX-like protein